MNNLNLPNLTWDNTNITYTVGTGINGDATWVDYDSKINTVSSRLDKIEERLLIIQPDQELMKKYPALKEAYDHYKLIEALVNDKSKAYR